ncbi:MAG: hypothetical protein ACRC1G_00150 [Bradyrhizobium sp.]|nr:hypothetical protein [Bradyrhizobium sp.]
MSRIELDRAASTDPAQAACPDCNGDMTLLKIIPGRAGRGGCEYWTMRCTSCGGIHLDIVEPASAPPLS